MKPVPFPPMTVVPSSVTGPERMALPSTRSAPRFSVLPVPCTVIALLTVFAVPV